MHYVCWKLNFKEIITIEEESFTLQKGVYYPKQTWQWQKSNIGLRSHPSTYRMSAPKLFLCHLNDVIEIGGFLNKTEKKELKEILSREGIQFVTKKS